MKVLIIGASETGFHIASEFTEEQYEVTVIDENPDHLRLVRQRLNVAGVKGSGTDLSTLEEAGIEKTNLLIACTDHDETNIVSCLLANQYQIPQKVAIIRKPFVKKEIIAKFQKYGISMIVNVTKEVAFEIIATASIAVAVEVAAFAFKKVLLVGYRVTENSPLANRTLIDIFADQKEQKFLIACVVRNGKAIIPRGGNVIEPGDYTYIMMARKSASELNAFLNIHASTSKNAILAGGTPLSLEVAHGLCLASFHVTMICPDQAMADSLDNRLKNHKNFRIITGNCIDIKLLRELKTSDTSLLITMNHDDHLNITSSAIAHALGVEKTIAIVHRQDLVSVANDLGIDVVISPRLSAARKIKKMIRGGETTLDYTTVAETGTEVLEMKVGKRSEIAGKTLREIQFPKGCVIGVIVKPDKSVLIPHGPMRIDYQDKVVVVTKPENLPKLEKMIEGEVRNSPLE